MSETLEELGTGDPGVAEIESLRARLGQDGPCGPVAPGARWLLLRRAGGSAACLSWETAQLHGAPGLSGLAGHFEAVDVEAGVRVLHEALRRVEAAGAARLVGPMNGSTWEQYRLALPAAPGAAAEAPPFLTEPWNPAFYPDCFREAGFSVAARYESRIADLPVSRPRATELARRMERLGIRTRPLDTGRLEEEFRMLLALSEAAFAGNPYYRALPCERIRDRYRELQPLLDPEFVRLAHDPSGRLLGFVLAFPDLPAVGGLPTRLVLKTLATAPPARALGLGAFLADAMHERAYCRGYRAVIHALMHETNESVRLSHRYGSRPFRRYALYQCTP